ncbi:Hypothetical protein R9X50_00525300 [Acrodontium crateriforme]|uniref:Class E vacuolar protein-sorting machinery protein HSE1 n=1 Tax=Acrodontium crateriforme TaxID=150365 RepID=A0AAQ3M7L7_9PEZI|nr:Hypothetical protein R9X50_00525300 [Acrodontium crateriforme]
MFRAQANPMDEAVVKATDENLTSENWEFILDVCDRVSASASGPSQAIASLLKRLAHRNANVQLYTLELANSLSQNCGAPLHRELASKAFTDALLRLAGDRSTHAQVKQKVLERMGGWSEDFRSNPDLGIMEQAYRKLRLQQPSLMPPSKPVKAEISSEDRQKEDEELQMALALSVQDKGVAASSEQTGGQAVQDDSERVPAMNPSGQQGTTAATVSRVRALYDFTPSEPGELAFRKNDIIAVLESVFKDWWKGSLRGQTGIFPLNYVEKLQDPTKEEMERDAQMEADVFGEIKNVEKLLALLSVRGEGSGAGRRGEREEEEITDLYQRTLSIRPKLIELIGKYSQKKDDFTQLNEKFIKARRDYEALLESSMSQPQQYQQQYPIRQRQQSYPPQHQQQPPYQQAPGYPPQGPSSTQGYPPQQPFGQSGLQTGQHPQDPNQQFYSPTPSDAPGQQPGYSSPYPPHGMPPPIQPAAGSAPFHFIPGGVQAPSQEIRRKPSPAGIRSHPPEDAYKATGGGIFQGQIRPNSIHTLNSGNPQELATGGYESPVDNRHSYPPAIHGEQPQHDVYDAYVPSQQQQYTQPLSSDRDGLPSNRQRAYSFEGPGAQGHPSQPSGPPGLHVGPPSSNQGFAPPGEMTPTPNTYQAYQPHPVQSGGGAGQGGDPGDFYR